MGQLPWGQDIAGGPTREGHSSRIAMAAGRPEGLPLRAVARGRMPSRPLALYATGPDRGSFCRTQASTAGCCLPAYLAGRDQLRTELWADKIPLKGRLWVTGLLRTLHTSPAAAGRMLAEGG